MVEVHGNCLNDKEHCKIINVEYFHDELSVLSQHEKFNRKNRNQA